MSYLGIRNFDGTGNPNEVKEHKQRSINVTLEISNIAEFFFSDFKTEEVWKIFSKSVGTSKERYGAHPGTKNPNIQLQRAVQGTDWFRDR